MDALTWLGVAALGGGGAVARLLVDGTIAARLGRSFPVGTLGVNVSGAFAFGLLTGLGVGGDLLALLGTGLLGSYTTFSTWMYETQRLAEDGAPRGAVLNVALGVGAGFAAVVAGRALGGAL